jgi:hypothetical protein
MLVRRGGLFLLFATLFYVPMYMFHVHSTSTLKMEARYESKREQYNQILCRSIAKTYYQPTMTAEISFRCLGFVVDKVELLHVFLEVLQSSPGKCYSSVAPHSNPSTPTLWFCLDTDSVAD